MHAIFSFLVPPLYLPFTYSLVLLHFRHLGKRTIHPIRLDRSTGHILLVRVSEYKFQVLTVSLAVTNGKDADGELEDVELCDTGAGVFQERGGGGVHRQSGHFADGVPARGGNACVVSKSE